MKLLNCLLVLAFLFLVSCNSAARISLEKELQVVNLFKRLTKPPPKSIKSPDGDIIDCILFSQQIAFDPKNHKVQLEHPGLASFDHKKVNRTIPVRRTKKEDVLRASSIENFGRKDYPVMIIDNSRSRQMACQGSK